MMFSPLQVVCFPLLGKADLALRRFLRLLLERVCQHDQLAPAEETQHPERVSTDIGPDLPDVIRVDQFLEILGRHMFQVTNHTQHPRDFLEGLIRQRIEMLLNGTPTAGRGVERDPFHSLNVNISVNFFKASAKEKRRHRLQGKQLNFDRLLIPCRAPCIDEAFLHGAPVKSNDRYS
jgi:hypothetical protein